MTITEIKQIAVYSFVIGALGLVVTGSRVAKVEASGTVTITGEQAAGQEPSQVPDLEGEWSMVDDWSGLASQASPRSFIITRVVLEPNGASDGYFLFKWRGAAQLSRGHFSINTGRVWFNTNRTIKGASTKVRYDGRLQSGH